MAVPVELALGEGAVMTRRGWIILGIVAVVLLLSVLLNMPGCTRSGPAPVFTP
jgi:hypothetical protein